MKIAKIIADKSLCPLKNSFLCGVYNNKGECQICKETEIEIKKSIEFKTASKMGMLVAPITDEICCLCGKRIEGQGNNPYPLKRTGRCCDECNIEKVIPARILKENDHHEIIEENGRE